jgi:hypothetical protein
VGVEVSVGTVVTTPVGVSVLVGCAVFVWVAVGVLVTQGGDAKLSCIPALNPPVLHSNCVNAVPRLLCTPTVALDPPPVTVPYTTSKLEDPSCSLISKFSGLAGLAKSTALHSMLKMRLGALPDTEVKIPHPDVNAEHPVCVLVIRSSQCGKIVGPYEAIGKQVFVKSVPVVVNWALPLDDTFTLVYEDPYSDTANGMVTAVVPSSVWLPVSVVPATIVPVAVAIL